MQDNHDEEWRKWLKSFLTREGHSFHCLLERNLSLEDFEGVDLVLVVIFKKEPRGDDYFLRRFVDIFERYGSQRLLILDAHSSLERVSIAFRNGVANYFRIPDTSGKLRQVVADTLREPLLTKEALTRILSP